MKDENTFAFSYCGRIHYLVVPEPITQDTVVTKLYFSEDKLKHFVNLPENRS